MRTETTHTDRWTLVPTFGELVRQWRLERGVTQIELANVIGRKQHTLSNLETGEIERPDIEVAYAIAKYLDKPFEELLPYYGLEGVAIGGVAVPFYGPVPADAVRWVHAEEEGRVRRVPADWLGSRPPEECLVVRASGECLEARRIHSGDFVLLHRLIDRTPRDGQITLVRFGDEFTLKVFVQTRDGIELQGGNGAVIHRLRQGDEAEFIGTYVAHWGIDET